MPRARCTHDTGMQHLGNPFLPTTSVKVKHSNAKKYPRAIMRSQSIGTPRNKQEKDKETSEKRTKKQARKGQRNKQEKDKETSEKRTKKQARKGSHGLHCPGR